MIVSTDSTEAEFNETVLSAGDRSADVEHRSVEIEELRSNLRRMERGFRVEARQKDVVSTGVSALDDILPGQGIPRGTLSEWIAAEPGSGAASLAMRVAGQAQADGPLIVVDRNRHFYAPAVAAAGVLLSDTIFVRPESRTDELWAIEQSLRCPGVGAVLCQVSFLKTVDFRRLQLAAESGTAIGLLIRSADAQKQSGWADVRLLVSSHSAPQDQFCRRLEVRCVYAKGVYADRTVELELCDETGELRRAF